MRAATGLTCALCLLCACTDKAAKAEERLKMIEQVGTPREICAATRDVANAYLEQRDEGKYRVWRLLVTGRCMVVRS